MSVRAIRTVAGNTMREALRSKVLFVLVFFAVAVIGSGFLLALLSYVERDRILQDVGFGAIRLIGAAIAVFLGVGLIHREVERRTVYTILSKPVSRTTFVVGKFVGLTATVWMLVGIMGAAFFAVSFLGGAEVGLTHGAAILLVAFELAFLVAVATFFSCFTTPLLASGFTVAVFFLGHLTRDLRDIGAASESPVAKGFTAGLYWVLPDLDAFDLTLHAIHDLAIGLVDVGPAMAYAFGYALVLLWLGSLIFERRDLR